MKEKIMLLSGSANIELAKKVSESLGVPLTPVEVKRFNDGETYVRVGKSVRGHHVFIIQPTSPPVNDNLMELLILVDALKRASAKEITAVIPYYGYARQDRKSTSREPITARLVAGLIEKAGVHRVVTFDLHVDQIQGFFDIPVDNLEALPVLARAIGKKRLKNLVVVAPDVGGATRARRLGKVLDAPIAVIDKRRPMHGRSQVMNIIGEVKGKDIIIFDDIIDTAGSTLNAAKALKERGAKDIYVLATHPVLSNGAVRNLSSKEIREVMVTDSIPLPAKKRMKKISVVSLAPFIGELITTIAEGTSMGVIVQGRFDKVNNE